VAPWRGSERWALLKQAKAEETKPKRTLSAAGRKRIVEAARKRWAAVKAKKETSLVPAAAKRAGRAAAKRKVVKKPAPKKGVAAIPAETAE
jgi:hypothetical protein